MFSDDLFIMKAFKYCIQSERRHQVLIASLLFLLFGVLLLILRFIQVKVLLVSSINNSLLFFLYSI
jgi:hypothetical protein